jgi:exodeoxyribonuclease-1
MSRTTAPSFFFYDLETSGFNPRSARVLQFAGQRTDMELKPLGQGISHYLKLTPDVLPEPGAVIVNGITPQISLSRGISEVDFLKIFEQQIDRPGTIFVGYNNVRFDDEFIRFMRYRNFYDPYEWQWKDGRSRWDLLDVVRMTRALRPANIAWPFDPKGRPSNRLELLASVNKLEHLQAHEALSDVNATIALARLIRSNQPKLFEYLLSNRDKKAVEKIVRGGQAFIYTSGKFKSDYEKTTIVYSLGPHPSQQGDLVYDLRYDPMEFAELEPTQLAELWRWQPDEKVRRLPVKTLQFNRCPVIAPLSVLDDDSRLRLKLDRGEIERNLEALKQLKHWPQRLHQALELLDKQRQAQFVIIDRDVDSQLYEGFIGSADKAKLPKVRQVPPEHLGQDAIQFKDPRLSALLPLYKARNFPESLMPNEQRDWQSYLQGRLFGDNGLSEFGRQIEKISLQKGLTRAQKHSLADLRDYGLRLRSVVDDDSASKTKKLK